MKRRGVLTMMVGVLVLSVGLVLGHYGSGAQGAPPTNPLTEVLAKLDQILAALTSAAGQNNHTLRWDTNNPSAIRFTTAFPGAVLDNNTGLVWEQAPDITGGSNDNGTRTWAQAIFHCVDRSVGGTRGWRLPSVVELAGVKDLSLPAPFVPASVFSGVQVGLYWSTSTVIDDPSSAWSVDGSVVSAHKADPSIRAWCVRGGMNADAY